MRIAIISPIAWSTPPKHYGPWEQIVSLLTEGLIKKGLDVTLFATGNSKTNAKLHYVAKVGYEEDASIDPKVWECLHISEVFEQADKFDLIHNHFDFLPLTYSSLVRTPIVTTIHGFSSPKILPVFEKYNGKVAYVAISNADRSEKLDYLATIHHGIDVSQFTYQKKKGVAKPPTLEWEAERFLLPSLMPALILASDFVSRFRLRTIILILSLALVLQMPSYSRTFTPSISFEHGLREVSKDISLYAKSSLPEGSTIYSNLNHPVIAYYSGKSAWPMPALGGDNIYTIHFTHQDYIPAGQDVVLYSVKQGWWEATLTQK